MREQRAEIILEFCDEVDALARELMLQDNQVSGKHYAAMRLTLKKRFGTEWPADAPSAGDRCGIFSPTLCTGLAANTSDSQI